MQTKVTYTQEERIIFKTLVTKIRSFLSHAEKAQRALKEAGDRGKLYRNRYFITAVLNHYLALRGKTYRHATVYSEYEQSYFRKQYQQSYLYKQAEKLIEEDRWDVLEEVL